MSCILKLNLTILHTFQVSYIHAEKSLISHHLMNRTYYLIGVVGAGDQQEDPGEGVLGWIGNLPGLRAWVKVAKKKKNVFLFKKTPINLSTHFYVYNL